MRSGPVTLHTATSHPDAPLPERLADDWERTKQECPTRKTIEANQSFACRFLQKLANGQLFRGVLSIDRPTEPTTLSLETSGGLRIESPSTRIAVDSRGNQTVRSNRSWHDTDGVTTPFKYPSTEVPSINNDFGSGNVEIDENGIRVENGNNTVILNENGIRTEGNAGTATLDEDGIRVQRQNDDNKRGD